MNARTAEEGMSGGVALAVLVICCAMMATLLALAST
ncbi:hypothetical protein FHW12_003321 [Dokdonella fugitiva]|uniref:Uncharacterized protein n=1 Tax=Dokdonella fugitiva TaxID=328517 RepID=A0A839EZ58_9GAMM|nr:hypothetical protein [Dokdonella fugitiva]